MPITKSFSSLLPVYAAILLLFVSYSSADHDLETEYSFSATLDNDYKLYWSYDLAVETIRFAVRVRTEGWVGFGLSPNGQMPGSDVVIGWVTDQGEVVFHDRFAEGRFPPPIDESQDWILEFGEEKDSYTVLGFRRNITNCDPKDLDIQADTSHVVWSWHSSDPEDAATVLQHQFKGATSLNLLGGLNNPPPIPPDSDSFTITMESVIIPSDKDTTYWCHAVELPQEIRDTKIYVYKIAPTITEGNTPYVHHMVIYLCSQLNHTVVGQSSECDSAHIQIRECVSQEMIAVWAVGGNGYLFPKDVALGLGGPGSQKYYAVIEMHYDNPQLKSGVEDSSGLEFFYSYIPPVHEAGVLPLGHSVTPGMIIPPKTDNYVIEGICPGRCTERFFPPDGITVFGSLLHTHIYGHGLRLQHFRKNEECNVTEELEIIDENLRYDFNYQQFNHLPKTVKVMPGDSLVLQCLYRTLDTDKSVLGGKRTRDEMCFVFFYYYPRVDLSFCLSVPSMESYKPFTDSYIEKSKRDALLISLGQGNETAIRPILETVDWNPEAVQGLEDSVLNSPQTYFCFGENGPYIIGQENISRSECPYEAADTCTGFQPKTCCERVAEGATGGGEATLYSSVVVALCWLLFQLKLQ